MEKPTATTKPTARRSLHLSTNTNGDAIMQSRLQCQNQNLKNGLTNIDLIHRCVGVLRSKWYNKRHQLATFSYGTAFLVTNRILITCTHNLFSKTRNTWAHQVEFAPGVKEGEIESYYKNVRRSFTFEGQIETETYRAKYIYSLFDIEKEPLLKGSVSFQNNPQNYEVSLVILQERASGKGKGEDNKVGKQHSHNEAYLHLDKNKGESIVQKIVNQNISNPDLAAKEKFISLREYSLTEQLPLTIVGYPSLKFKTMLRFEKAYVKRSQLNGLPYIAKPQNNENIIHYRIQTSVGMSGSPILVCDGLNYYAVGIHTHRGHQPGYNSGIYFDAEIIKQIRELEMKIQRNEKIPCGIDYVSLPQILEVDEKDNDTSSIERNPSPSTSSRVNSPMDAQLLPQQQVLSDHQYDNMSQMSNMSQTSSPLSNVSDISQLDGIFQFFSIVKEPLCDSQHSQARAFLLHSCDLSKLSYATRVQSYSNQLPQQDSAGRKIAHF